ncbi:Hypothetical_protein [Hexamita inflata]|uniref:Hypothetical_protein n=1 Tax=Hexamita inflata TaxID=28002 RepID=A0AA86TPV6_9EUKA|nr:Hypothetical protein HINF_LOCUS12764 [Hexamita inflata]
MQLKYKLNSLVIILDSDKPSTKQELQSLEPRNIELIEIKGANQLFNIQVISKYITDKCSVQINNCKIDLSTIQGTYNKMIIRNCTVTGTVQKQLSVKHLTIQSQCGLKQFSEGTYETIDVIVVDQDRLVDFAGCNEYNSLLNSLQICNSRIDLGSLEGNWKSAEFKNTVVSGQFTNNFYCTELKYHDVEYVCQILNVFKCRPKRLVLYCERNYQTQYDHIANIKHCCVDVTFTSCEIDLNKYINQFPDSRQIEVDNSQLTIQYPVNVINLSLKNVEIDSVPILLFNNLVSIKCIGKKNQQIHNLERIVFNRNKFTSKNLVNKKLIERINKDSGLKFKNIVRMDNRRC